MTHHAQLPSAPAIPDDNQQLSDELTRLAAHINAAQYRFLKLLAALIARDAWGAHGIKTPAHWLNYYCGIDMGAAREKVRVAKALADLPRIDEAFRSGALSYSKVRAMTRSATPENEEFLLQVARHGTAQHVEQLVRKYQRVKRQQENARDKERHEARAFHWYYDDDGMLVFHGRLPAEEGAAVLKALEAVSEELFREENSRARQTAEAATAQEWGKSTDVSAETFQRKRDGDHGDDSVAGRVYREPAGLRDDPDDPMREHEPWTWNPGGLSAETPSVPKLPEATGPTPAQRRADALVIMAEQVTQRDRPGLKAASPGEKYQVIVHLPVATGDPGTDGMPSLEHHGQHVALSDGTMRRLCCDASIVTLKEDAQGNPLNIGRRSRVVPPAMRRALQLRDKGCRFPGCCESRFVDAHHIQHWCDGGETSLENLVLLCRRHHRLVHTENYRIEKGEAGCVSFHQPDGSVLAHALFPQFDTAGLSSKGSLRLEEDNTQLGLEIDSETAVSRWYGQGMDLGMAVDALIRSEGRLEPGIGPPTGDP